MAPQTLLGASLFSETVADVEHVSEKWKTWIYITVALTTTVVATWRFYVTLHPGDHSGPMGVAIKETTKMLWWLKKKPTQIKMILFPKREAAQ